MGEITERRQSSKSGDFDAGTDSGLAMEQIQHEVTFERFQKTMSLNSVLFCTL